MNTYFISKRDVNDEDWLTVAKLFEEVTATEVYAYLDRAYPKTQFRLDVSVYGG